jgi:hypothetical protein
MRSWLLESILFRFQQADREDRISSAGTVTPLSLETCRSLGPLRVIQYDPYGRMGLA